MDFFGKCREVMVDLQEWDRRGQIDEDTRQAIEGGKEQ